MRIDERNRLVDAKVDEWRNRALAFGTHDCCQFAAEMVAALTGNEHRAKFPTYSSRREAALILAKHGGMVGLASSVLGEPKPWGRAEKGDVVVADFGDGPAAGVCVGAKCCAPGPKGLVFLSIDKAIAAWSVE